MAQYFNLEIDVRLHVKKYILYHLSDKPLSYNLDQPVKINTQNSIGLFILSLLEEQFKVKAKKKPIIFNNKKLNHKIDLLLSERYYGKIDARYKLIGISDKGEIKLDDFIDGLMKKEMFIMCESYRNNGRKIKEAINDFMDLYNITEEDIQRDSLYREYKRMVNQLKTN